MTQVAPVNAVAPRFDRDRLARLADGLAVALAVSLPWSTSATGILVVLWLLALLPTVKLAELVRELREPACGFPLLLWGLGVLGLLWSPAGFSEQLYAIKGSHKFLVLPFLFIQFRRSDKGFRVLGGYLASCTALLAVSWFLHVWPHQPWRVAPAGVPVKDYIVQSVEFVLCAFAFGHLAVDAWLARKRLLACGQALLAVLFVANVAFVATGRTSLAAFPVLLMLFGLQRFGLKGTLAMAIGGVLFAAAVWIASPHLRERVLGVIDEIQTYRSEHAETSSGYRLEFWRKSLTFVAEAPIAGHGTGSIPVLFRRAAIGDAGITAAVTGNPHNQILEIAIQLGLIGVAVLFAMWMAHILLFRGASLAPWLGQILMTQTIVGSLFLSYLLDFSTGWIYVLGVGVLGGMAQRPRTD